MSDDHLAITLVNCWLNNGNTCPPALYAGEEPGEELKSTNYVGPYDKQPSYSCIVGLVNAQTIGQLVDIGQLTLWQGYSNVLLCLELLPHVGIKRNLDVMERK